VNFELFGFEQAIRHDKSGLILIVKQALYVKTLFSFEALSGPDPGRVEARKLNH
jgi:hypothetical protein